MTSLDNTSGSSDSDHYKGEQSVNDLIFNRICSHIPDWSSALKTSEDLNIKRLNGLSNACYRVSIKDEVAPHLTDNRTLLYRKFEQELTDKRIESAIFRTKSEDKTGPYLHFMNTEYRIEGFFEGRPISIWEMRNPAIYMEYSNFICDYNFSSVA